MLQSERNSQKIRFYNPEEHTGDRYPRVNAHTTLGETIIDAFEVTLGEKVASTELKAPALKGPFLALFAGEAVAEKELLELLPPTEQQITAIDYNPNLKSNSQINYLHGDVFNILPRLESSSFGLITVFGADESIEPEEWPILLSEIDRITKPEGYVVLTSAPNLTEMQKHFQAIFESTGIWIGFKKGESR
ncbi:MAG TPA: methyltransferase domain-containing protein [Patescibacteria group bacterium]